jgi:hypothetical protein
MAKLIFVCAFICAINVLGYTKYLVPDWPTIGNPVYCIVQESYRNPVAAAAITTCSMNYCSCMNVTRQTTFNAQSLQCLNFPEVSQYCPTAQGCGPAYIKCIDKALPGCSQAAQLQCEEHYMRKCNEGKVCKWGATPAGLTAGAILAIAAGIVYIVAALIVFGLFVMAKNMKAETYDPAEQ